MNQKTRQKLDLLKLLVKKEITLKYKRTTLGFFWSLLNPLLTGLVFFIAFRVFMRFEMEEYTLFLLSALFPWTWFSTAVSMSTVTLTNNVSLIRKILFPKHYLLLAVVIGQMVNFLLALPIIIALVLYYGKRPSVLWLLAIPVLLLIQFTVTLGLSLLVSILSTFFSDLEHIVAVCLNLMFWMTPIIYPLSAVPEKYRVFLSLNPVTYLILCWRDLFLENTLHWNNVGISMVTGMAVAGAGTWVFVRLGRRLDEVL